jgi:hypothetical protein
VWSSRSLFPLPFVFVNASAALRARRVTFGLLLPLPAFISKPPNFPNREQRLVQDYRLMGE